jgi:hypothetical protein
MAGLEPLLKMPPVDEFDYSTPEAQAALAGVTELVLEIRDEVRLPLRILERKVHLYERTLGLAVAPALIARASTRLYRRIWKGHDRAR